LITPQCVKCVAQYCAKESLKREHLPKFCPMIQKADIIKIALEKYKNEKIRQLYVNTTIIEGQAYEIVRGRRISVRPRLLEIIKLSKLMGWKRLGVAFCGGLTNEASRVVNILEKSGFEVYSIVCSCGHLDKTFFGVQKEHKIANLIGDPDRFEEACNPIVQAEVLNSENLDLHIIVGLCIGHDMLFTKYSKALVTTFIVKDRVTGHNPIASLYSVYYRRYYDKEEVY